MHTQNGTATRSAVPTHLPRSGLVQRLFCGEAFNETPGAARRNCQQPYNHHNLSRHINLAQSYPVGTERVSLRALQGNAHAIQLAAPHHLGSPTPNAPRPTTCLVDHGQPHISMAEQLKNGSNVIPGLEQTRCEGVTKGMAPERHKDPGHFLLKNHDGWEARRVLPRDVTAARTLLVARIAMSPEVKYSPVTLRRSTLG